MNKRTIFLLLVVYVLAFVSCETSEGLKYGTLQKISHKTFPCDYYVVEFAFEGGRMVQGTNNSSSYQNTQEVEVDKAGYDTLQALVGKKVVFDYKGRGMTVCAPDKLLTSIKVAAP